MSSKIDGTEIHMMSTKGITLKNPATEPEHIVFFINGKKYYINWKDYQREREFMDKMELKAQNARLYK